MEPLRIYLIGAGIIADCHANGFDHLPGPVEMYAADPVESARKTFAEKYPGSVMYETSDEMLASDVRSTDIVVVCTPPFLHKPEAIKALNSGRHVLCEKPFAMNMMEAEEMVETADSLGLILGCCSNRHARWSLHRRVCRMVRENALGEIYLVDWIHRDSRARRGIDGRSRGSWWSLDRSKAGGGRLMDLGCYDVAVWMDLFNPVQIIVRDSVVKRVNIGADIPDGLVHDVESHVSATLEFTCSEGMKFLLRYERTDGTHGPEYSQQGIYGMDGYLTWDLLGFGDRTLYHHTSGPKGERLCKETVEKPPVNHAFFCHDPVFEFARYIQGDRDTTTLTGPEALENFSVLMAIYENAESGEPVNLTFNGRRRLSDA